MPAVSNWRRRHPSFPAQTGEGPESFPVAAVAAWLDGRKISKADLRSDELPGTTYGTRFRKAMSLGTAFDDAAAESLWRELNRLRGWLSPSIFSDLVLGLFVLATSGGAAWENIVSYRGPWRGGLVVRAASSHELELRELREICDEISDHPSGEALLAEMVRLLDRVRRVENAADVFDFLQERFVMADGRRLGEFHAPTAVTRLLAELAAPEATDRVLDPCCGTGRFLVAAAEHITTTGGRSGGEFTGHALNPGSASLARMNLWFHGVRANVDVSADRVLRGSPVPGERFDVILSNPPFDMRTSTEFDGPYGTLPRNRSSFAWLQYVVSSLAAQGRAAIVMPGGTLFRGGAEKQVRANMVDAGVVEAIIALPPQLFVSTGIPVTVWLLTPPTRAPRQEVLFIDASESGQMISRTQRNLSKEDRSRIVDTVVRWRGGRHELVPGFAAAVPVDGLREEDYVLVPARHVGLDVEPAASADVVRELHEELERLELRAAEVDAVVARRLGGVVRWIR